VFLFPISYNVIRCITTWYCMIFLYCIMLCCFLNAYNMTTMTHKLKNFNFSIDFLYFFFPIFFSVFIIFLFLFLFLFLFTIFGKNNSWRQCLLVYFFIVVLIPAYAVYLMCIYYMYWFTHIKLWLLFIVYCLLLLVSKHPCLFLLFFVLFSSQKTGKVTDIGIVVCVCVCILDFFFFFFFFVANMIKFSTGLILLLT